MYDILLGKHEKMLVNNVVCETLDPKNPIAKLYQFMKQIPVDKQQRAIKQFNEHVKEQFIKKKKSNSTITILV